MTANSAVVAFLINASWQIALVALAAAGCARLMRGGRARDEHRLWIAALILAVVLPVTSALDFQTPQPAAEETRPRTSAPVVTTPQTQEVRQAGLPVFQIPRPRIAKPAANVALLVAALYALFVAGRVLVLLRGWRRTQSLRAITSAPPKRVLLAAQRCRDAFALADDVPILVSERAETAITFGAVVILPKGVAEKLSDEALLSLIGHEMAHIRRRDFLINIVWEALYALVSFHPAAAFIRRRLAQTREQACDELVSETLVKPVRYAHALLDVAALLTAARRPAWSLAMADHGFEERVLRLARPRRQRGSARLMVLASTALLFVTAVIGSAFGVNVARASARQLPGGLKPALHADPVKRAAAACEAGRARDASAIPMLVATLGDATPVELPPCYSGRWTPARQVFEEQSPGEAAALALAAIGAKSIGVLVPLLADASPIVRRNAAWAIGEIRGGHFLDRSDAMEPLIRIANDSDPTVRRAVAFAFSELRDDDAIEPLIAALGDPDDGVRAMAAFALGELRAAEAEPALRRMRDDPDERVRSAVAYALREIND